jgi:hypothetical protein
MKNNSDKKKQGEKYKCLWNKNALFIYLLEKISINNN